MQPSKYPCIPNNEKEVLDLYDSGMNNEEIALYLDKEVKTVDHILAKYGEAYEPLEAKNYKQLKRKWAEVTKLVKAGIERRKNGISL